MLDIYCIEQVYRTYIVWASRWKVAAVPFFLLLADIGQFGHLFLGSQS